jgi:hypothetical protein
MKIARVFLDFDMRCSFEGIRETLKKNKIDLKTIGSDFVVILMNRKTTAFKILIDNAYIVYFKNGNRRIPLEAIQYLPQRFGGSEAEFNKAVEKVLLQKLATKQLSGKAQSKVIRRPAVSAEARH